MKNKKVRYIVLISFVFMLVMGVTYAYFSATLDVEGGPNDVVTQTGTLSLRFTDGPQISLINAYPGAHVEKQFTVENTGTLDTAYSINWEQLLNEVQNEELVVSISYTSNQDAGTTTVITNEPIVAVAGAIVNSVEISASEIHTLTIRLDFLEKNSQQNYNQGKKFIGVLSILEENIGFKINGTLLNSSGNPVSNASVTLHSEPQTTTTNSEGKFVFDYVDVDEHTFTAVDSNNTQIATDNINISSTYLKDSVVSGKNIIGSIFNRELNLEIRLSDSNDIDTITLITTKWYDECDNNSLSLRCKILADNTEVSDNYIDFSTTLVEYASSEEEPNDVSCEDFPNALVCNGYKGLYYTSNLTKTEDTNNDGLGERVYYYRGKVTNNYVQFAGFCWKIIRTNENGSVKLMYWGETNDTECSEYASAPSSLEGIAFNTSHNDNRYVGYMYGTSCNDYESCHTNTTNSTIKTAIDDWYRDNIASQNASLTSKIADTIYCNDRSLVSGSGSGDDEAIYGPSGRLWYLPSPQYDCPNDARDAFTLKVASGGTQGYGNNMLDYPVGLLTADEISYAGTIFQKNSPTYFLNTSGFWTMSPFHLLKWGIPKECFVTYQGFLNYDQVWGYEMDYSSGSYPVISLNSSALVSSGQGTVTDPYVVQ